MVELVGVVRAIFLSSHNHSRKRGEERIGDKRRRRDERAEGASGGGSSERGDGGACEDLWARVEPSWEEVPAQDPKEEADRMEGGTVVPLRHQERGPPRPTTGGKRAIG